MTSNLTGTAALVTGARSGIGAPTARLLAEHGSSVTLVARRKERRQDLAAEMRQEVTQRHMRVGVRRAVDHAHRPGVNGSLGVRWSRSRP
jgi:NADP-dependent 3-hydroxy acid dehydrogenase YdfG